MHLDRNKVVSFFLILAQLCTITLVQMGHVDQLPGGNGHQELRSHDCGATEKHLPVSSDGNCLLCQRVTQFVSISPGSAPSAFIEMRRVGPSGASLSPRQETVPSCFERGPPVLV